MNIRVYIEQTEHLAWYKYKDLLDNAHACKGMCNINLVPQLPKAIPTVQVLNSISH